MILNEPVCNRNRLKDKTSFMATTEDRVEEDKLGVFETNRCKIFYIKYIKNKVILYSSRELFQ